jgi:hypothetical protein
MKSISDTVRLSFPAHHSFWNCAQTVPISYVDRILAEALR